MSRGHKWLLFISLVIIVLVGYLVYSTSTYKGYAEPHRVGVWY